MIFEAYRNFYYYDRTRELKPLIESTTDDNAEHWRREKITFNAAYGGARPSPLVLAEECFPALSDRREQAYFQFRCEMYNAFNQTQFNAVDKTARFDPGEPGKPAVRGDHWG